MTTKRVFNIPDDEFRRDFKDSVMSEEIDFESIPAELMDEFKSIAEKNSTIQEYTPSMFDQLRDSDL